MSRSSTPARTPSSVRSQTDELPPLLVICGPTATGKTGLSLALADAFPGAEVISADSRQVYRGMDIGTAKVSAAERARVPHHGLDVVDPDEPFTAADFRRHALGALRDMAGRVPMAILVGGTGLYLRAVGRGMALEETGHDPLVRAEFEARLASDGLDSLVQEFRRVAPVTAGRTDLANPRRVLRGLERVRLGGDRLPPRPRGYPGKIAWIGVDTDVGSHDAWVERRAREQFEVGLLDEADRLRRRFDSSLPAFSAFGYREAFDALDGRTSLEEAVATDARRTRQFARRQRTWFRREPDVTWLEAADDPLPAAHRIAERLI
jgi:tRNA dimethylallyltransferase